MNDERRTYIGQVVLGIALGIAVWVPILEGLAGRLATIVMLLCAFVAVLVVPSRGDDS